MLICVLLRASIDLHLQLAMKTAFVVYLFNRVKQLQFFSVATLSLYVVESNDLHKTRVQS